jgi:uncharacterized DUF497 family protein
MDVYTRDPDVYPPTFGLPSKIIATAPMTFRGQIFEFDPAKAASNRRKHKVTFTEAMTVFEDRLAATIPDEDHSESEERFTTIGLSSRQRVLLIVHLELDGRIRLISAREASASEKQQYEED